MAGWQAGDVLGRTFANDEAATAAAFGTKVDDPIGCLDDIEIVLDDQHRVALIDQARQHREQAAHVFEMQTSGGFVEQINGVAGGPLGKLGGEFHALRFATRQRGGRLTQAHVAEPHIDQRLHVARDGWLIGEETDGLGHRHIEHLGDVLALELNVECVAVVASTLADLARHVDVGKEVHLDLDGAITAACFTAATGHVEAEAARHVATHL